MPLSRKTKLVIILIFGILIIGTVLTQSDRLKLFVNDQPKETSPISSEIIADLKIGYDSQEKNYNSISIKSGATALDLIQQIATISSSGKGEMAFITTIDGRQADNGKKEFWEMLVNGKPSQVGAGTYKVQDKDKIEWRISTY